MDLQHVKSTRLIQKKLSFPRYFVPGNKHIERYRTARRCELFKNCKYKPSNLFEKS